MVVKGYEDLEIYQKSYELAMNIHEMTLELPNFEMYEEGSQIRKASKSIAANLVEGFGRRRYKREFIKFVTYAYASCLETKVHLNFIYDSSYITKKKFNQYFEEYDSLGRKIHNFMKNL